MIKILFSTNNYDIVEVQFKKIYVFLKWNMNLLSKSNYKIILEYRYSRSSI